MRALVTGGTGFIGNRLVLELVGQGWEVVCLARRPCRSVSSAVSCLRGDLLQSTELRVALSSLRPLDAVFHFGAVLPAGGGSASLADYLLANTVASAVIADWAAQAGVAVVVCASTMTVIGKPEEIPITETHPLHPASPYAVSKLCAEFAIEAAEQSTRTRAAILRIASPYGPGMKSATVLPAFVEQALASQPIACHGTGSREQNFVHVSDVVRAALAAAQAKAAGIFNIAGERSVSMAGLAEMVCSMIPGAKSKPSGEADLQEGWRWEVDCSRARQAFGYIPLVDLRHGLQDYLAHRSRGEPVARWWAPA